MQENGRKPVEGYDFLKSWSLDFERIQPAYELVQRVSRHYQTGILSNIYKGMFEFFLENDMIPNVKFAHLFVSSDIGYKKPDDSVYEFIENKTGYKQKELLFIDDREDYLAPARIRGWQTHQFTRSNPKISVAKLGEQLGV